MKTALVLSGGVGLGAYQAGAYAALHPRGELHPQHLAGASIGAINAALIAGGPAEKRIERLERFWARAATEANPFVASWAVPFMTTSWRHASSWASAMQTRLFGRSGLFMPRMPELLWERQPGLYDMRPLRATLNDLIDFDRLNSGEVRLSIMTTDAETGDSVVFDTGEGDRIGADHILASCGFFPDFPSTRIAGRTLADGGFSANAPVEAVLHGCDTDLLCFVVDLFSARGYAPRSVQEGASRQWELLFGNQSRDRLARLEREHQLRRAVHRLGEALGTDFAADADLAALLAEPAPSSVHVLHMAYRPRDYEAGPQKAFDFSPDTLRDRWRAGVAAMERAMDVASSGLTDAPGFNIYPVPQELAENLTRKAA
jgi:NTE family protein